MGASLIDVSHCVGEFVSFGLGNAILSLVCYHVDTPHGVSRGLLASLGRATVGGLTAPPQAFRLSGYPTASMRSPSSLILRAAFISRSWTVPQIGHCQVRSARVSASFLSPQTWHSCVEG